jgi:glycerol-3-phosphate cytidylyltransferase-like family protein
MLPAHQAENGRREQDVTGKGKGIHKSHSAEARHLQRNTVRPTAQNRARQLSQCDYVDERARLELKREVQAFRECRWRSRRKLRSATAAGRSVSTLHLIVVHFTRNTSAGRKAKQSVTSRSSALESWRACSWCGNL